MSIRQSLLAILDQGAAYGYQLRVEFERRTGGSWPLNVGQVYATLDRLERDDLVAKSPASESGQVYYEITAAGSAEVADWLASPVDRPRDELVVKLALVLTLPGADAAALLTAQRAATTAALAELTSHRAASLPEQLVAHAHILAAEAELAWLDYCETLIPHAHPYGLDAEPPQRGRPRSATRAE